MIPRLNNQPGEPFQFKDRHKMTRIAFTVLFLFTCNLLAQTTDDMYRIIERKLQVDKTYLDIYSYNFTPDATMANLLPAIPLTDGRGVFRFNSNGNINYSLVFKKPDLENDTIMLLYVLEIGAGGAADSSNIFGSNVAGGADSNMVVKFKDFAELYFSGNPAYYQVLAFLNRELLTTEANSLAKVDKKDKEKITRGISSDGNLDFIAFQTTNSLHKYPKAAPPKTSGRGRGNTTTTPVGAPFQIDGSLSSLSFFHPVMDYGFGFVSVEFNTHTPVVNIIPWKGQSVTGGVRALFSISGSIANPLTDMLIDAKLMGRFHLDMNSFLGNLPFVMGDPVTLNVGNGFIFDVKTTGSFNLPFFNAYFAYGPENLENPSYRVGSKAYFTFTQWESTMSFFWNNSEKRAIRYKMDIGAGGFDVIEADYSGAATARAKMKDVISPVIALSVNFVPNDIEFLGTDFRFFDNHLTSKIWIKLLEFGGDHNFRVEMTNVSASMFREPEVWESKSSQTFIQLRYRYGF